LRDRSANIADKLWLMIIVILLDRVKESILAFFGIFSFRYFPAADSPGPKRQYTNSIFGIFRREL